LVAEEAIDMQEAIKEVRLRLLALRKQFVGCPKTEVDSDGD
jgi:hypothetical protein